MRVAWWEATTQIEEDEFRVAESTEDMIVDRLLSYFVSKRVL